MTFRYGSVCSGIEAATAAWHHMGWEAANVILANILMEAAHVVAESESLITVDEAIGQAVFNLAYDAQTSGATH